MMLMEVLSNEINMRLSQELDYLMSMMHSQINSSAISDTVNPETQNIIVSLSWGQRNAEFGTSVNNQVC